MVLILFLLVLPQNRSNGDEVVFELFKKGHNTCKKKSSGVYQTDVYTFVHAYVKQAEKDAENNGGEYEVDDEAMEFLSCQEYYYNNNLVGDIVY